MFKNFKVKSKKERKIEEAHRMHDMLDIVTYLENSLAERIPSYTLEHELDKKDEFHVLTDGDIIEAGHVMIDLHSMLKVDMDYVVLDVYEKFPTVDHILKYFMKHHSYLDKKKNGTL